MNAPIRNTRLQVGVFVARMSTRGKERERKHARTMTKGGKAHKYSGYSEHLREKIEIDMKKFKQHKLHSGPGKGHVVTDRKQALAIAYSQAQTRGSGK